MKEIQLSKGFVAIVDDVDYEALSAYKWCVKMSNGNPYAVRTRRCDEGGPKTIRMHRVVLQPQAGMMTDHTNGNTLDNRRCNLREATNAQNQQNKKTPRHNTSGYRGVTWHGIAKRWVAQISKDGAHYHLGYFKDPKEAHKAYVKKAKELHGEFFFVRTF